MHPTLNLDLLNFTDPIIQWINAVVTRLPMLILLLLVGILTVRITIRILKFVFSITIVHEALRGVLISIIEIILWIFLSIGILHELGFEGVILFFTGSIAALGLAMAAGGSTLVADIIAGIFLARDVDFGVGDEVIVGETPTQGIVESLDARRTRIRDKDGVLHIIPNSIVERKEWVLLRKSQGISPLAAAVSTARHIRRVAAAKTQSISGQTSATRKEKSSL